MDNDIISTIIQLAQALTTKAQGMTTQANQEIVPRPNQQIATYASHLRDFTRMNPPTFYGPRVEEHPQEFIDEVYMIFLAMGLSTSAKDKLATY